jgi:Holliday junction resolvasome RuvABC DNA-binding subunit
MLDAVVADQLRLREGGIQAVCGHWVLALDCAGRDAEQLMRLEHPVIWTEVTISDETIILIGFADAERRELFRALRRVSGIGRRSALLVLDLGDVLDILRAVAGGDRGYFRGIPGLGDRRIEAVVNELRRRYQRDLPQTLPIPVAVWVEARDALVAGGEDAERAERLLAAVAEPAADTEVLLEQIADAR